MKQPVHLMIVDDETSAQQFLSDSLKKYEDISVCAKAYSIREAKLRLDVTEVDAVFLDVELGNENGFELAGFIREKYPKVMIIFVTGHMELALDGYDYEPLDYLVKPVDPKRLGRAVERLKKAHLNETEKRISPGEIALETAGGSFFIPVSDILYCELRNRRVYVGRRSGAEVCCISTIDKMEKLLCEQGFLKVYQSVLVRSSEIDSVEKDQRGQTYHVKLRGDGLIFPASRQFFYETKKITRNHLG